MAERARRLYIEDARRNGRHLRTTWHPDGRQFVISTWDADMVCTGAVRVSVEEAARLVGHLAVGLADGASPPEAPPAPSSGGRLGLRDRLRRWLRLGGSERGAAPLPTIARLDERRSA